MGIVGSLILSGCAGETPSPEKSAELKSGKFKPQELSADLVYEDLKHSFKLKADIYLLAIDAVRLDVRTQFDYPLASLYMTNDKLEFVNYRDRKYFSGKPGPRALDSILPMDISASDLVSVVQEKPVHGQKCDYDGGQILACRGAAGPTSYRVSWSKRDSTSPWSGKAKKMVIQIPNRKISLNFYFTEWQKVLSKTEGLTTLNVPADFHK